MTGHFDERILTGLDGVFYVPVRHHSPACAAAVRALVHQVRPRAILIEGPCEYNPYLSELALDHRLPIAIYGYRHAADEESRGVFYPFCEYSPEWQALQSAHQTGAHAQFIDAPWHALAEDQTPLNRYHDGDLRQADYIEKLCQRMGVDNFDALWDLMIETDPGLTPGELFERIHRLCFNIRCSIDSVGLPDRQREAFMAVQVRRALNEIGAPLMVVTGGFHSYALFARLQDLPFAGTQDPVAFEPPAPGGEQTGLALTPYSDARLDALTGYEAGMPGPGFYHLVWLARHAQAGAPSTALPIARVLINQIVEQLREKKQTASTADLIALETMAHGLAALRGHKEIWRRDISDAVVGALVKDELALGLRHPFLEAVHEIFRGQSVGTISAHARRPPLYADLRARLEARELWPGPTPRTVELDLKQTQELESSQLLHQMRVLKVPGFMLGMDGTAPGAKAEQWGLETWRLAWSPQTEAACIEAALYGATLPEAAGSQLAERAGQEESNAQTVAALVLDACRAGLFTLGAGLQGKLVTLIRQDSDFISLGTALRSLLFIYRYDTLLGTTGVPGVGQLLLEGWERALLLMEMVCTAQHSERILLQAMQLMLETFERTEQALNLNRDLFFETLQRISRDARQLPLMRGSAMGILWLMQATHGDALLANLRLFSSPEHLGDYLVGLLGLAREIVQRDPSILTAIDHLVMDYTDEQYLEALPALRLAFSVFTARERHHIGLTLQESGATEAWPLQIDITAAAQVMAFESRLKGLVERYHLDWRPANAD